MPRRRGVKRPTREYIIALVLLLVVGWFSFLVLGLVSKEERARHAAHDAEGELKTLTEREAMLKQNIADLATDRGKEASLRETYGVARTGEEVIIVIAPEEEKPLKKLPWWNKVLGFFGL